MWYRRWLLFTFRVNIRCLTPILIGTFLGMTFRPAFGQNLPRQQVNSLHNALPIDASLEPTDTTIIPVEHKWLFEFVGGPSICFWTREDIPDQVLFHRYVLAFAVVHRTTKTFNLEAKILWEPKGVLLEWTSEYDDLFYKQGNELDYVTLALTGDFYVDCKRRLYVGGGLGGGMLVSQTTFTYGYDENGNLVSIYSSEVNAYRKFEMGLIANVGYRRNVGKNVFVNVQAFGNFGITDLTKKFDPDPYPNPSSNANLALMFGIGFSGG